MHYNITIGKKKEKKKKSPNCQYQKLLVLYQSGKKREIEITKELMAEEIHQHAVCKNEG